MLEVLVTLAVVAIALLGTAGLQLYAMRLNQGGQFRSQAVFLVADIAERMEANKAGAVAGLYAVTLSSTVTTAATDCSTAACNQTALAAYDLSAWQNSIAAILPQGSWLITQDTAGNPSTYTITVNWVDRRSNTTYATAGSGETFSYTATRTIFN
jgi:type IV pilus assembly protein PilV